MLAKKYRLPASFFRRRHAPVYSTQLRFFRVRAYSSSLPYSRFVCIVPNGAFPNIVQRNKFRRSVYDAIRAQELFGVLGRDIVIFLPKGVVVPNPDEVYGDVRELGEKLKTNH
jgi:RNase P protein component